MEGEEKRVWKKKEEREETHLWGLRGEKAEVEGVMGQSYCHTPRPETIKECTNRDTGQG